LNSDAQNERARKVDLLSHLCISSEEIHKWGREIGISNKEIHISSRKIPESASDLCISLADLPISSPHSRRPKPKLATTPKAT